MWKARWGIGRMKYLVPPGLYAIGHPHADSPVLVTANYKMTYDTVRHTLEGRHCWLLILETYGINVWCAAGRGTFGTEELIQRIRASGLAEVIHHRQLILPILGASGVAAHTVTKQTGFHIRYAAIRAKDIPRYLDNGMNTTQEMREITLRLGTGRADPHGIVGALKPTALVSVLIFVLVTAFGTPAMALNAVCGYIGAVATGTALTPLLLPWLPGRSFAFKGALIGLSWTAVFCMLGGTHGWSPFLTIAYWLILPTISAFYALTFTGSTPFTSRSGVKKEVRIALPIMACALLTGIFIAVIGKLL